MGNKHMKRHLTSLIMREMQIKTKGDTISYLSKWLLSKTKQTNKQKTQEITSVGEDMEKRKACALLVGI